MGTYRMYTDSQGKSRWEEIDLGKMPAWLEWFDVAQMRFSSRAPGEMEDWHPAPRRQFVIIVSGQLQIGFDDGSTRIFGPGDARLVEDVTGKGHTTVAIGNEPCITATVSLKNQG